MSNLKQTLDVEFFRAIAHELRTQDNLGTAHPLFCVEEEVRVYVDESVHAVDGHEWLDSDEDCPEDDEQESALEECYQETGRAPDGWRRVSFECHWEERETFLTREAANAYIANQHYNHRGRLRLYVASAIRNPEMRKLREQLLAVADHLDGGKP